MIKRLVLLVLLFASAWACATQPVEWQVRGTAAWSASPQDGCGDPATFQFHQGPSALSGSCWYQGSPFFNITGRYRPCTGVGETMSSDGVCAVVRCPQGEGWSRGADLNCSADPCKSGTVQSGLNSNLSLICTPKVCPTGQVLSGDTCIPKPPTCIDPETLQSDGTCAVSGPTTPTDPTKGPKGDTGVQGLKGDKGDKGDTGDTGSKGDVGSKGEAGNNGSAGATGATGAAGANGVNGATGGTGAAGAQGVMGLTGMTGAVGATGLSGVAGAMGLTGAAGVAGAAGTNGVDGKDGKSFCEENPGLAVCRDSTVAGSCAATTCSGDAIQCATLRQAADLNCRQQQEQDALKASSLGELGTAVAAGADPKSADLPTPQNGQSVDIRNVDASGWLGGGALFADKSISVQGHTIVIPLSKALELLLALRYALMVAASLVSFRLLSGAILGA